MPLHALPAGTTGIPVIPAIVPAEDGAERAGQLPLDAGTSRCARHRRAADANAYRLALQFLLEKINVFGSQNRIVIADEAKEQQLRAVKMVADMQQHSSGGEVPGRPLKTVIDSLHFVQSNASPGVQLADLVAYMIQRSRRMSERHPDATAALARLRNVVSSHTLTWREPWPRKMTRVYSSTA
jgi:Protein of unknown function (DUF3800)